LLVVLSTPIVFGALHAIDDSPLSSPSGAPHVFHWRPLLKSCNSSVPDGHLREESSIVSSRSVQYIQLCE